jgi:DNA-binding XRE family transcriptional regulator
MPTLREVRIRQLLSRRALAEQSGVSSRTIAAVEDGENLPRLGTARKLADALGVAAEEVDEFRAAIEADLQGKDAA